jgi:hypothetical protein
MMVAAVRASALAFASFGQMAGFCSAAHSQMARLSATVTPSHSSAGTRALGEIAPNTGLGPPSSGSACITSSKSTPAWRSASQGRMDQDE